MISRLAFPALAALALTACGFGGKAPDLLLTLTPDAPATATPAGTTASSATAITVVRPTLPKALNTTRVPVMTGQQVTYLEEAFWVDTPDNLFRSLLSETISSRTGRAVLDPLQFSFDPGTRLTGQLQNFGLDSAAMEAVVTYDAALARGAENVTTRRFEARIPVTAATRDAVAPALNQAANRVAADVAAWIGA